MAQKVNPQQRSVVVPDDLWEWITAYAEKKGAPRSTMIRMILTEFRAEKEKEAKQE